MAFLCEFAGPYETYACMDKFCLELFQRNSEFLVPQCIFIQVIINGISNLTK